MKSFLGNFYRQLAIFYWSHCTRDNVNSYNCTSYNGTSYNGTFCYGTSYIETSHNALVLAAPVVMTLVTTASVKMKLVIIDNSSFKS